MKKKSVRPEDALQFLKDALRAPPKSQLRQTLLHGALMCYYFGRLNQDKFGVRDDRRGRPKGTKGAGHKDDDALLLMTKISADLAENRPGTLARLAVKNGGVQLLGAQKESVIKRLADRWRSQKRATDK